jgi:hypothetical protein
MERRKSFISTELCTPLLNHRAGVERVESSTNKLKAEGFELSFAYMKGAIPFSMPRIERSACFARNKTTC